MPRSKTWAFIGGYTYRLLALRASRCLRLCHTVALPSPVPTPRPTATRPWSLRERLTERDIAELINAYRDGTTAASLAAAYALSLKSVKRLLRTAGVRRTPPTQRAMKATPVATHP
jgi:hypothetical protein